MATPLFSYKQWTLDPEALKEALKKPKESLWMVEQNAEDKARAFFDEITATGGRPSRNIREEPLWTTELLDDNRFAGYNPEKDESFIVEIDKFWRKHWLEEWVTFKGEYDLWVMFLKSEHNTDRIFLEADEQKGMRKRTNSEQLGHIVYALRQWRAFWDFQRGRVGQFEKHLDDAESHLDRWSNLRSCKSLIYPNPAFEIVYEKVKGPARKLGNARNRLTWFGNESLQMAREAFALVIPNARALLLEILRNDVFNLQACVEEQYGVRFRSAEPPITAVIIEDLVSAEKDILQYMDFANDCTIAHGRRIRARELKRQYGLATELQLEELAMWQRLEESEIERREGLDQWLSFWRISREYFESKSKASSKPQDQKAPETLDNNLKQSQRQLRQYKELVPISDSKIRAIQAKSRDLRESVQGPAK